MLNERGREGCGSAAKEIPVRGRPEGTDCDGGEDIGRPATDTGRERGGPEGDAPIELLDSGGDWGGDNAPGATMTEP